MGVAGDTKKLGEDIIASYDLRVKEIRKLEKDTQSMLKEFQGEQKDMAAKLKKTLEQGEADRIKASGSLKSEIQAEQEKRNKEVADLLQEFSTEKEKMSANWQTLTASMSKRRSGKPTVEAEVKVRPVEETIEEETKEDIASPEIGIEEKVLGFIKRHPKGVKVGDMEEPLGVTRMRLGQVAKGLLVKGMVRKEENMYFPL